MGWGDAGKDSEGRPIGYNYKGVCDMPGCAVEVNRGLAHACGGQHGEELGSFCPYYFCPEHLDDHGCAEGDDPSGPTVLTCTHEYGASGVCVDCEKLCCEGCGGRSIADEDGEYAFYCWYHRIGL